MVCKHKNFMLAAFEVVLPSFERSNYCQQLTVMGLIPSLNRNHLSEEKGYRVSLAQIIRSQLTENSTNGIAQNIYLNLDITLRIKII